MKSKILLIIIIGLTVFGCGKKEETRPENVVVIDFWHGMGGPLGTALDDLVQEFNRTHPEIYVNHVHMGNYTALSQKIMASVQAGNQPDIAQSFEAWTANMMKGDVLRPLDDFIEQDPEFGEADLEDFYPVFVESNTIDGKLMSFPFNKSVRVLYYNKDKFFINDMDPNKPPANWEEYRDYLKRLTKDTTGDGNIDQWGTTYAISAWHFQNLLLQAGGEILSEDNTKALFNSSAGVEALNLITDILMKDKSAFLSTGYDGQNDFLAGNVAMFEGSSVSMVFLRQSGIDFNLGIAAIPTHRTNRSLISGTNVVIFRKDDEKRQQAAWEFVKWFAGTEQTAKWSYDTYYMPVRRSALEEPQLKQRLLANPEIASVYRQLENATFDPQISEWFEARKYLEEQVLERVIRGTIAPKEALDRAAVMIEKRISERK